MEYRIGGELEIGVDQLNKPIFGESASAFGEGYSMDTDTGRSALLIALRSILKQGGKKEAWVPRFCCESVLQPFQQLGFKLNFYSMGDKLDSVHKLPQTLDGETFLYIHYFGKKNHSVEQWLDTRKNLKYFLIEDCVQACFNDNVGKRGDYVVRSFRKFLPQPDGALLSTQAPLDFSLERPDEEFVSKKFLGKFLRGAEGDPKVFLELFTSSEDIIDQKIVPRRSSFFSRFLYERTDLAVVKAKRIENFNFLVTLLRDNPFVGKDFELLFEELESGEVPLGIPIRVMGNRRDELRRFLMGQNIFCPVHWPIADKDPEWQTETDLSNSILTLVIDQRLDKNAIEYLGNKLIEFFRG